jgi:hypothetical protein
MNHNQHLTTKGDGRLQTAESMAFSKKGISLREEGDPPLPKCAPGARMTVQNGLALPFGFSISLQTFFCTIASSSTKLPVFPRAFLTMHDCES